MDFNVKFNSPGGITPDSKGPQQEAVQDDKSKAPKQKAERTLISQEAAMDYLVSMGNMNITLTKSAANIDPSQYLSQERMDDIAASMQKFEALYQTNRNVIESEFGNTLSQAAIDELAWRTLA